MESVIYTGKDVKITFGTFTARFKSIAVEVMGNKFIANPSDTKTVRRGTATFDAKISIVGMESDEAGAGKFSKVAALVLSKEPPTNLAYTDAGTTPVSLLPANFFTEWFPLNRWRVDSAKGGSSGPENAAEWSAELSPNNDD